MKILALAALMVALPAGAEPTAADVQNVLQRDLHPRGQAGMDRLSQDAVQRACTESRDHPSAEVAKSLQAGEMKSISFPDGDLIGDWKKGEAIAQSGRGMTWNDKAGEPAGGSCYNCHELSPKEMSHGTIGPSLKGFGKKRGTGNDVQH